MNHFKVIKYIILTFNIGYSIYNYEEWGDTLIRNLIEIIFHLTPMLFSYGIIYMFLILLFIGVIKESIYEWEELSIFEIESFLLPKEIERIGLKYVHLVFIGLLLFDSYYLIELNHSVFYLVFKW